MRKIIVATAIVAIASFAPGANATGTASLDMAVTTTAPTSCTMASVTAMAFAPYVKLNNFDFDSSVKVTCAGYATEAVLSLGPGLHSDGVAAATEPVVVAHSGGRRMISAVNAEKFLTYGLFTQTGGAGTCLGAATECSAVGTIPVTQDGTEQTLHVFGYLPSGQTAWAGSYADTVIVTVTF